MWGKSGAVEEEEGVEIIMSNRGVDYVIEKKKTNHVIVGKPPSFIDKFLNNKVRLSRSGAMTAISTARRSLAPIDVTAALYSAPIAVTIAVTSRSGAITAIALL
ncbi:hypothetical protein L249_4272 [Ophiocordyceps polyrhachis-furcata BCC 54312]|uniref:Uncharacterized protein n=1 Tax=Ophiocordyceps polyrhachis-furcata BCC 54312 TaxID=1330021 RepID=A0A367L7P9_9HYPO|nr:hypothetical protein L249_4272 [Ophiocordyceps polyrhachis-furcata BCC 54312]